MPNIALSEARIKALRSRPCAYDIRDAKLKGFVSGHFGPWLRGWAQCDGGS